MIEISVLNLGCDTYSLGTGKSLSQSLMVRICSLSLEELTKLLVMKKHMMKKYEMYL